jgi:hypothetical protein
MNVIMPPRWDGTINVTPEEVEDARQATEDVELVRADGTLTKAGQLYVADTRRTFSPLATIRPRTIYVIDEPVLVDLPREGMSDEEIGDWLDANRPGWKEWGQY